MNSLVMVSTNDNRDFISLIQRGQCAKLTKARLQAQIDLCVRLELDFKSCLNELFNFLSVTWLLLSKGKMPRPLDNCEY